MPLYARVLSFGGRRGVACTAFGASAITHPFVWFVFPGLFFGWPYWLYFLTAESFVVILEAWYLKSFGVRRAFAWSLLTNGISAGFGLLMSWLS